MSLPNIPNITPIITLDREEALTMLLASIALEEMGLAHIINAEGEKIQYVLNTKINKSVSIKDIQEVNQGVEKVIRSTTKLQMILQEKLENVISLIHKRPEFPDSPCSPPEKPKGKPDCILTGSGEGCVTNKSDLFYRGIASVESGVCSDCYDKEVTQSLKYSLCKKEKGHAVLAILLAIPESIEICCPKRPQPCSDMEGTDTLIMKGQGVMAIKEGRKRLAQCTVYFTLRFWRDDCTAKFKMIIGSPHTKFNHNSGIVSVESGNLREKIRPQKEY
ncbi:hypothetical protein [Desulfotomaculum sp. 1211_IL3151]|uniref:hypothetical protein n=1 Tax=Desulfotomaculum sp. 1211_IL3151 TaxID=3084055 RepID=UPI002FDB60DF